MGFSLHLEPRISRVVFVYYTALAAQYAKISGTLAICGWYVYGCINLGRAVSRDETGWVSYCSLRPLVRVSWHVTVHSFLSTCIMGLPYLRHVTSALSLTHFTRFPQPRLRVLSPSSIILNFHPRSPKTDLESMNSLLFDWVELYVSFQHNICYVTLSCNEHGIDSCCFRSQRQEMYFFLNSQNYRRTIA